MADNTVTLVGNVTRDPELRYTNTGQSITSFGLAVNRVWNDRQSGERREQVSFFDIKCWGQLGENAAQSLAKGSRVIVTGRLEQRSYETQAGEKRNAVEINADEVGPSLRWATAEVVKNDRRDSSDAGVSGPRGGGQPEPAPASYSSDEEPF
jgi:single-strand DNA-binding protein